MNKPASILITGSTGLLGRNLRPLLEETYPDATLVASPPSSVLNLREQRNWLSLGGPFEWVFHLSARFPEIDLSGLELYKHNAAMNLSCLECCMSWGTTKIVYASSISVYPMGAASLLHEDLPPRPDTFYAASKLAGEHLFSLADRPSRAVSLRFSSIYGTDPSPKLSKTVLFSMVRAVQNGANPRVYGTGARTQDFIHAIDAARICLLAAQSGTGGVYNAGSGTATSMADLAATVLKVFGGPGQHLDFVPDASEGTSVALDVGKARRELGYVASVGLESGLMRLASARS